MFIIYYIHYEKLNEKLHHPHYSHSIIMSITKHTWKYQTDTYQREGLAITSLYASLLLPTLFL